MIQIENNILRASFQRKGAELKSLVSIDSHKEWMWKADPAFWGKTSPILFPIVGGLKGGTYCFEGKNYHLSRHGFARDMEFEVRLHEKERVIFGLSSSNASLNLFPFDFDLEVEYVLDGNGLSVKYCVKNPSTKDLYFSLGAHPAFAIDVNETKVFSDYKLFFEKDTELHLHPLRHNLLQKETVTLPLKNKELSLAYSLFEQDALVMTDMQSQELCLFNTKDDEGLRFKFSNFSYFGIWSAKNADFVCLEPWSGIADFEDHQGDLTKKFGINKLAAASEWRAEWSVKPIKK